MTHDVWVVHPNFSEERDPIYICDREDIDGFENVQINPQVFRDGRRNVRRVLLRRLGGWWAELGDAAMDVDEFIIAETSRSTADDLEFIVYPATWSLDQAEAIISPYKAGKAPRPMVEGG